MQKKKKKPSLVNNGRCAEAKIASIELFFVHSRVVVGFADDCGSGFTSSAVCCVFGWVANIWRILTIEAAMGNKTEMA